MSEYSELKRLAEHHQSLGHPYTVATPDAVLALIAENERLALANHARDSLITKIQDERDQLKAENERLKSENDEPEWHLMMTRLEDQNVQLKAENEALRRAMHELANHPKLTVSQADILCAAMGKGEQS